MSPDRQPPARPVATRSTPPPPPAPPTIRSAPVSARSGWTVADEDGSLVTEYGLLAIVAATIAGMVIQWATGGAIVELFSSLLSAARGLVGA